MVCLLDRFYDNGRWVTDEKLEKTIAPFGKIYRLKFVEDKVNGKSRGVCYVQLEEPEKTVAAIEKLHGMYDRSCRQT